MAVQKSKKSRSKRGHRRSKKKIMLPNLFFDKKTGKFSLYHHVLNINKKK